MARKVFISVLGFSNYGECIYIKDDYKSSPVRFIQEATLDYLQSIETWTSNDVAYILLTKGAEKVNWYDDGHNDRNTGEVIKCQGLCSRLQSMQLPFDVVPIKSLPHGNSEEEIWEIFERIFTHLQEGDELYFDLTHGFRYLPMLVLVLINYSKFLRNTKVCSITYGNYESRNAENEAPIIDLLPLSVLQDWTFAAGQYLDSGSVSRLVRLSSEKIDPILKHSKGTDAEASALKQFIKALDASIEDMQTCRGVNIVEAANISKMKKFEAMLQSTFIKPLNPIFENIKYTIKDFSEGPDIANGFVAARWCSDNGLYQQAITILQENIVTLLCSEHNLNYKDEKQREPVNKAFAIHEKNIQEAEWAFSSSMTDEDVIKQKEIIREILSSPSMTLFSGIFSVCTEIRNDINHSGMRCNPAKASRLKERIQSIIRDVCKIVYNEKSNTSIHAN